MTKCFYCEGSYLPPNQRNKPNPKYAIHETCLWEMVRSNDEVEAVIRYLMVYNNIPEFKDALKRIKDFHERMNKARHFQKSRMIVSPKETKSSSQ